MKAERLHELADAYGADLRRWPASERAFAESLIAADPSLKAVLDQAAALDALLDAAPKPVPSAALTRSSNRIGLPVARMLSSALAHLVAGQGDATGVTIFDAGIRTHIGSRPGRSHLRRLLNDRNFGFWVLESSKI